MAGLQKCDAWAILGAVDTVVLAGKRLEWLFPLTRGSTLQIEEWIQLGQSVHLQA